MLRMVELWPLTRFVWITLSSDAERAAETRAGFTFLVDVPVKGRFEPDVKL